MFLNFISLKIKYKYQYIHVFVICKAGTEGVTCVFGAATAVEAVVWGCGQ